MLEAAAMRFAETPILRPVLPQSIFSVSVFHGAKAGLDVALGVALPERPVFLVQNGVTYMWSGPGSWLVFGANMVGLAAAKPYAAITDQSDGRAVFEIDGPNARAILAKLVPIDLHDAAFALGATALTLAGHINVQIWRVAENGFALACFRSFAKTLYDTIIMSGREFES